MEIPEGSRVVKIMKAEGWFAVYDVSDEPPEGNHEWPLFLMEPDFIALWEVQGKIGDGGPFILTQFLEWGGQGYLVDFDEEVNLLGMCRVDDFNERRGHFLRLQKDREKR